MSNYILTGKYHLAIGTDVEVGDTVTGNGVPFGTVVDSISEVAVVNGPWNNWGANGPSYYLEIELSQVFQTGAKGIYNRNINQLTWSVTGVTYFGWQSTFSFSRLEQITEPDPIVYLPSTTLSFREDVKGWVSFKSFTPDNTISCANEYYSFTSSAIATDRGLWMHHDESVNRNTFYNVYTSSSFTVIFNEAPGSVKSFKTLNYEGSQARILENINQITSATVEDGEYYNLTAVDGWFVESTFTNLENGGINEFIEKEGKWFGYFTGIDANVNSSALVVGDYNTADFSVQGIGGLTSVSGAVIYGCMDSAAFNYNETATIESGSCVAVVLGCIDPSAFNYNSLANTSNASVACTYLGCTDPTAFNYDASATLDNGSCIPSIVGCTDLNAFNYNPNANVSDDAICIPYIYGCIVTTANNYDAMANTDDGSCTYDVLGCTDNTACNYNLLAVSDDNSCVFCGDLSANNYDSADAGCDSGCEYCPQPLNLQFGKEFYNYGEGQFTMEFNEPTSGPEVESYQVGISILGFAIPNLTEDNTDGWGTGTISYTVTGIQPGDNGEAQYFTVTVTSQCDNSTSTTISDVVTLEQDVLGCTDSTACNYNVLANNGGYENEYCDFTTCLGCMDLGYLEFCDTCWDAVNLIAVTDGTGGPWVADTDPSTCLTAVELGCTNDTANNFAFYADTTHVDDGSCLFCGTSWGNPGGGTGDSSDYQETAALFYGGIDSTGDPTASFHLWTPAQNDFQPHNYAPNTGYNESHDFYSYAQYGYYGGFSSYPLAGNPGDSEEVSIGYEGLEFGATYNLTMQGVCSNSGIGNAAYGPLLTFSITMPADTSISGCTDSGYMDSSYVNNQGGTGSYFSTSNSPAFNYNPEAGTDDDSCNYTLRIGDYYKGGIVFNLGGTTGGNPPDTAIVITPASYHTYGLPFGCQDESWHITATDNINIGKANIPGVMDILQVNLNYCTDSPTIFTYTDAIVVNDDLNQETFDDYWVPSFDTQHQAMERLGPATIYQNTIDGLSVSTNSYGVSLDNIAGFDSSQFYLSANAMASNLVGVNPQNVRSSKIHVVGGVQTLVDAYSVQLDQTNLGVVAIRRAPYPTN